MARAVQHGEVDTGKADAVAVGKPTVRGDVARVGQSVGATLLAEAVEQELVRQVRTLDRHATQLFLQCSSAAGVIDVAVREDDLVDLKPRLIKAGLDAIKVTTGID